ncbi:MAG: alpha-L-fucosidase C-terminal domain-containing protein, partial [Phycisphaerales bacterium]
WPGEEAIIQTLRGEGDEDQDEQDEPVDEDAGAQGNEEDESMSLVGKTFIIEDDGAEYTWVFKADGKLRVSGGLAGEGADGEYEQEGEEVFIEVGGFELEARYDGETFEIVEDERPHYPGFYEEEIKRITMLGDGRQLDWKLTRNGLIIETPDKKPCKHAYVFKIERCHHPPID